jgi:hypothetical protein
MARASGADRHCAVARAHGGSAAGLIHVGSGDYVLDEGTLMFKGRLIIQATFVVLVRLFYDNPRAGHDFYFELLNLLNF